MRTKTLLLTAALVAAGVASSMAQSNVYSLNVVGYVNVSLTNGFNLIANPLDADGTGTNNTVTGVFGTNLPAGSVVYKFTGGGFNSTYSFNRGAWTVGASTASFNPGEAAFVQVPTPTTVTFVGQVLQGARANTNVVNGFSLVGSVVPVSGPLDGMGNGGLNYVPINGDVIYTYDNSLTPPGYDNYAFSRGAWARGVPNIPVGTGFFLLTTQTTWVQNFSVQ